MTAPANREHNSGVTEARLIEILNKQFAERFAEQDRKINLQFLRFYGEITRYVDRRFDEQDARLDKRFDDVYTKLDAMAGHLEAHEQELAATKAEQRRHSVWVNQLAERTNTRLATE